MEIKKSPKADLEGKKGIFFEIGLTLALAILLFAFEWKSSTAEVNAFQTVAEVEIEEEIIPITQQMMKPPPPPPPAPKLTDLIDIVEDDTNIDEELEIQDAEDDSENQEVPDVTDFGDYEGEDTGEAQIFQVVEDMPAFPGNVTKWISKNVKYPVLAMENGIQGKVFVQFVIEKDGSITDVKVSRGVDASLDKEAVRVVKAMPKWKPGKQRGKPVRVSYTLPIFFQLAN
ncbi:MAG: energy transducer TonB [Odoribacter sp.]